MGSVALGLCRRLDAPCNRYRSHAAVVVDVIDEERFNVLYRETAGPLRAYAARALGNPSQADDVVQETYFRLSVCRIVRHRQ